MLQCKDVICSDRSEPRGPGQRPGVEADVDSLRFASARLRRSPGSAQAGGVKDGPAGPSAAVLDTAGYDIRPDRRRPRSPPTRPERGGGGSYKRFNTTPFFTAK
jgi:hypothetical protein